MIALLEGGVDLSDCRPGGLRVPCPPGEVVAIEKLRAGHVMDPPYVVKPNDEGSSVGVHVVQPGDNALPLDDLEAGRPVLVEKYIAGRELTVSVMGDRALAVTELRPHQGFYDYTAKYADDAGTDDFAQVTL